MTENQPPPYGEPPTTPGGMQREGAAEPPTATPQPPPYGGPGVGGGPEAPPYGGPGGGPEAPTYGGPNTGDAPPYGGPGGGPEAPPYGGPSTGDAPPYGGPSTGDAPPYGGPGGGPESSPYGGPGVGGGPEAPAYGGPSTGDAPPYGGPSGGPEAPAYGGPSTGDAPPYGGPGRGPEAPAYGGPAAGGGSPAGGMPAAPAYQAPSYHAPSYPGVGGGPRGKGGGSGRPGTVTGAAVLTHIGAAFVLGIGLLMLLALLGTAIVKDAAASGDFGDLTLGQTRIVFGCAGAGCLLFGVALIVLMVNAARGRGGARIALTVIGALFVVLFALSVVSDPWVLVPIVYLVLAVLLLWLGGANAWFRARKAERKAAGPTP